MSTSKPNKYVMRTIIILSKTNANNKEKKRKFILCLLYLLSKVEKHSSLCVECVNAEKRKKRTNWKIHNCVCDTTCICILYCIYIGSVFLEK